MYGLDSYLLYQKKITSRWSIYW